MAAGSNLGQVQAFNRRVVLEMIRIHGPISRAEITSRTNLTRQTISNIVADLTTARMVLVTGKQKPEGGGKPSDILEINPSAAYTVGINLYLDELTGVLLDLAGNIRQRLNQRARLTTPEDAAPIIEDVTRKLVRAEGVHAGQLWGAGIGLPGPLSTVSHPEPTPLSAWREAAVADEFSELLGMPVFFENNANVGAIGERWYGAGKQMRNFVYFSFGLYIGGGIILDGQLLSGSGGFAAEFGDVPTSESGDGHGATSLSEVASPATLLRLLQEAGEPDLDVEDLVPLFGGRHPLVLDWLERVSNHLAAFLTTLEYVLDPEAVIFGGRLPEPLLEDIVRRSGAKAPFYRTQNKPYAPRLLVSGAGADAAALGAATLPLYRTLDPSPSVLAIASNQATKGAEISIRDQLLNA